MVDDIAYRRKMVKAAMKAPYLERDEEQDLAIRWKEADDQEALHQLTVAHMRLVISMASRFKNFGLSASDLIQEGHVGLLEAAARFDPERGVRFSTYATWWIRAAIQDHVLRNWSIVRGGTSSSQKSLFFNLRRLRARIARTRNTISDPELYTEIANALGVKYNDVAMMDSRLSAPDTSLNTPISQTDGTSAQKQDFLVSDLPLQDAIVETGVDGERRAAWLHEALDVLNAREQMIVRQRRLTEEGATLESLGNRLGISKERV
ncbi:MAG: RNA polymerase factor sigma-32, partial [Alphaproteobacteria bacterium]